MWERKCLFFIQEQSAFDLPRTLAVVQALAVHEKANQIRRWTKESIVFVSFSWP